LEKDKFQLTESQKEGSTVSPPMIRNSFGRKVKAKNMDKIDRKIKKVQDELALYDKEKFLEKKKLGMCLMTFRYQHDARAVNEYWGGDFFQRMWRRFKRTCCKCCYASGSRRYSDTHVNVERAPEPSEIFFENLHLKGKDKLKIRSLSGIVMIILLVVSFGAVYGLTTVNYNYKNSGGNFWLVGLVSFMLSCVVVFINMSLGKIIRQMSSYEKYSTFTHYTLSVVWRLTLA